MRRITLIIIHCSAGRPVRRQASRNVSSSRQQHRQPATYHYLVRRDGTIDRRRPEALAAHHCRHHDSHSIGICYEGGRDIRGQPADTRTSAQQCALRALLTDLHSRYPRALIVGHHDLDPRQSCPCIDNVVHEYANLQPPIRP